MSQLAFLETRESAGAVFSVDREYRYRLWREWSTGEGTCTFVMLNPSTADECILDPTVRRCVGYAKDWGYQRLEVANIFALRSTQPRALYGVADPVGPENDDAILGACRGARIVVAAWGDHGKLRDRGETVLAMLKSYGIAVYHLGLTAGGRPRHPLYLPKRAAPLPLGV